MVATEDLADPTGPSNLSEIESQVQAFYSHIRYSLAMHYPRGGGEQESFLQLLVVVSSEGLSWEPSATGWIPDPGKGEKRYLEALKRALYSFVP